MVLTVLLYDDPLLYEKCGESKANQRADQTDPTLRSHVVTFVYDKRRGDKTNERVGNNIVAVE